MKTAELTGALLDYWVARANGWTRKAGAWVDSQGVEQYAPAVCYDPSHAWEIAGPIIEREHITLDWNTLNKADPNYDPEPWMALIDGGPIFYGPTPLISAMRAYVASKFGDSVPDEVQS